MPKEIYVNVDGWLPKDNVEKVEGFDTEYVRKDLYDFEVERANHLYECIKYEESLQADILTIGSKYLYARDGATIDTNQCWGAIKDRLKELDNE